MSLNFFKNLTKLIRTNSYDEVISETAIRQKMDQLDQIAKLIAEVAVEAKDVENHLKEMKSTSEICDELWNIKKTLRAINHDMKLAEIEVDRQKMTINQAAIAAKVKKSRNIFQ